MKPQFEREVICIGVNWNHFLFLLLIGFALFLGRVSSFFHYFVIDSFVLLFCYLFSNRFTTIDIGEMA